MNAADGAEDTAVGDLVGCFLVLETDGFAVRGKRPLKAASVQTSGGIAVVAVCEVELFE